MSVAVEIMSFKPRPGGVEGQQPVDDGKLETGDFDARGTSVKTVCRKAGKDHCGARTRWASQEHLGWHCKQKQHTFEAVDRRRAMLTAVYSGQQ
jgi:hypothetical protein